MGVRISSGKEAVLGWRRGRTIVKCRETSVGVLTPATIFWPRCGLLSKFFHFLLFLFFVVIINTLIVLCHCHPIISCFNKIQNGLSSWYRPTQVVLEKRPLNGCVMCVCVSVCLSVCLFVYLFYLEKCHGREIEAWNSDILIVPQYRWKRHHNPTSMTQVCMVQGCIHLFYRRSVERRGCIT